MRVYYPERVNGLYCLLYQVLKLRVQFRSFCCILISSGSIASHIATFVAFTNSVFISVEVSTFIVSNSLTRLYVALLRIISSRVNS